MVELKNSVNHRLPSGPATIDLSAIEKIGSLEATGNSVIAPDIVTRPIFPPSASVNQRFPSGPTVMNDGLLADVGIGNVARTPSVVMRPILLSPGRVNHRLPSGPAAIPASFVIPENPASKLVTRNSVIKPAVVTRPTFPIAP